MLTLEKVNIFINKKDNIHFHAKPPNSQTNRGCMQYDSDKTNRLTFKPTRDVPIAL